MSREKSGESLEPVAMVIDLLGGKMDGHRKVWEECRALFGQGIILVQLPQFNDREEGKLYELYIPEERLPDSFDELRPISINGAEARYNRTHAVKPKRGKKRHFWIFQMYVP